MSGTSLDIPKILLTDRAGPSQRFRVDPGQTGFFAGRMFRSYIELNIPVAGPSVSARFTSTVDFILWDQDVQLTQGAMRTEIFTGATPSGSWTSLPIIGVNRMNERPTPFYSPQVTIETGGSFTGGTAVDLLLTRCAANQGNSGSSNVGSGGGSERGLPPGTYYIRFSPLTGGVVVTDAAYGTYAILWEERIP